MRLTPFGQPQTTIIFVLGLAATGYTAYAGIWWAAGLAAVVTWALLMFFRDPDREVPAARGQMVSPADGRVSSVHLVEHFEPFNGPAQCIRIFLSVLDIHVNRSPCHGKVASLTYKPGKHMNALKPESAEFNESLLMVLVNPTHGRPVAAIRQVAGAIARRIVNGAQIGDILQRGERYGMIKMGSTTELYLPAPDRVQVQVRQGQMVQGGATVLATVSPGADGKEWLQKDGDGPEDLDQAEIAAGGGTPTSISNVGDGGGGPGGFDIGGED